MSLTYRQKQSALNQIVSRVSSAGKYGAQTLLYITALGAVAAIGGMAFPPELNFLLGNLGVNSLSALIERIAFGEKVSDNELQREVEHAIANSKIDKLLTKDDFNRALSKIVRNQHQFYSVVEGNSREFQQATGRIIELLEILENKQFALTRIDSNIFQQQRDDARLLDKKAGDLFLRETLPQIISTALDENFIVVLSDIDNLTQINKRYGNELGDEVIAAVARVIQKVSNSNYVGRCGDDTFYTMLSGKNTDKTKETIESIQLQIKYLPWSVLAADLRVTCSFGIAVKRSTESSDDVITRAAIGLTKAKEAGENTIKAGPKFLPKDFKRKFHSYYS